MTEREQRIAYNKAALQCALENSQRMYPGMITSMEMDENCMCGKAILAVTDDVHNRLPRDLQYDPHIQSALTKEGKVQETKSSVIPPRPVIRTKRSVDLNTLL